MEGEDAPPGNLQAVPMMAMGSFGEVWDVILVVWYYSPEEGMYRGEMNRRGGQFDDVCTTCYYAMVNSEEGLGNKTIKRRPCTREWQQVLVSISRMMLQMYPEVALRVKSPFTKINMEQMVVVHHSYITNGGVRTLLTGYRDYLEFSLEMSGGD